MTRTALKDDIIGHTLTRILRSPPELNDPGDDNDYSTFFSVGFELDRGTVIIIPWTADDGLLVQEVGKEGWLVLDVYDGDKCLGEVVKCVFTHIPGRIVVFLLANDYFMWQEETEGGVFIAVRHRTTMVRGSPGFVDGLKPYFN